MIGGGVRESIVSAGHRGVGGAYLQCGRELGAWSSKWSWWGCRRMRGGAARLT